MMSPQHEIYAHSLPGRDFLDWEPLATHAAAVAHAAEARAAAFGWGAAANLLGLLHDLGKASEAFQMYLRAGPSAQTRVDHSTAGARVAQAQFPAAPGRLLAFGIAGHHAGLPDAGDLIRRLDSVRTPLADFSCWKDVVSLPEPHALATCATLDMRGEPSFAAAFLARMLFSCLVDTASTAEVALSADDEVASKLHPSIAEVDAAFLLQQDKKAKVLSFFFLRKNNFLPSFLFTGVGG